LRQKQKVEFFNFKQILSKRKRKEKKKFLASVSQAKFQAAIKDTKYSYSFIRNNRYYTFAFPYNDLGYPLKQQSSFTMPAPTALVKPVGDTTVPSIQQGEHHIILAGQQLISQ